MSWLRFGALIALTFLLLLPPIPAAATSGGLRRFALVIGNNQPEEEPAQVLRYADDDVIAAHSLLTEAGVESLLFVTPDETTRALHPQLRPDGPARWADIERGFSLLTEHMRAARARGFATELLLFYSGHGDVASGEGYVVLEGARLTRSLLFSMLARSPATHNHVFVDACKSYYLVFDRGPGGRRAPYTGSLGENVPAELDNTGFVLSTSSARESHEWERYQAGILSYQLRSGLRGAADANLDGAVTYAELGAFLQTANLAITNPRFKPDFMVRAPNHELEREILSYRRESSSLFFAPGAWGHFYVENARGERLLDAHPSPEQTLRVRVPKDRPLFVRRNDERAEYVVSKLGSAAVAELSPTRPEVAQRGALSLAFEWIFARPFGESDVRAFQERAPARRLARTAEDETGSVRGTIQWTSGVTALTAATAGLMLNAVALGTSLDARGTSQKNIAEKNERIRALNRTSAPCYGVALAAGLTWALATFWPESKLKFESGVAGSEFSLGARRQF